MTKEIYSVIGVMSGTSLDGIDLVYTLISTKGWSFEIIHSETVPYTDDWHKMLAESVKLDVKQLENLDVNYTNLLAKTVTKFVEKYKIKDIDAISSHGHTVLHQPENKLTYQIGNREQLATLVGYKVICDFRVQDVALGGQGAPLVPIGDRLLFSKYDNCLNLGGFANMSFEADNQRIAFDICPINIVMNHYCRTIGLEYDDRGQIASKGTIDSELLAELNQLAFYSQAPPKSLGLEWVEEFVLPLIDSFNLSVEDLLRTFIEHVAIQITKIIRQNGSILITGGGTHNDFLISRIKMLSIGEIIVPSKQIIEYKEALIFALLGVLKMRGEVNCLSSVTGASKDHSSGKIFMP